MLILHNPDRL